MNLQGTSSPFPRLFCLLPVTSHRIFPPHNNSVVQYLDNDNDDEDESEDENVDEEDENEEIDIIM